MLHGSVQEHPGTRGSTRACKDAREHTKRQMHAQDGQMSIWSRNASCNRTLHTSEEGDSNSQLERGTPHPNWADGCLKHADARNNALIVKVGTYRAIRPRTDPCVREKYHKPRKPTRNLDDRSLVSALGVPRGAQERPRVRKTARERARASMTLQERTGAPRTYIRAGMPQ